MAFAEDRERALKGLGWKKAFVKETLKINKLTFCPCRREFRSTAVVQQGIVSYGEPHLESSCKH